MVKDTFRSPFGDINIKKTLRNIQNTFWKDVLKAFLDFIDIQNSISLYEKRISIWLNSQLFERYKENSLKKLKGIKFVSDITDKDANILSRETPRRKRFTFESSRL